MMRLLVITFCLAIGLQVSGQVQAELLVNVHEVNTADMNAMSPAEAGMLVFNTDSSAICYYDGSAWKSVVQGFLDSAVVTGDTLKLYEKGNVHSSILPGHEWRDATEKGMDEFIYAGQSMDNSDTTVFTDEGQLIMGASSQSISQKMIFLVRDSLENLGSQVSIVNQGSGTSKYSLLVTDADSSTMYAGSHGSGRTLARLGRVVAKRNEIVSIKGEGMSIGTVNKPLELATDNSIRLHIANNGLIGVGTDEPSEELDVDGEVRVRDLASATLDDSLSLLMTDDIGKFKSMILEDLVSTDVDNKVVSDTNGSLYIGENKSYVQTFNTSLTIPSTTATVINLFPQVTIQPNKKVYLKVYVPTRSRTTAWGGMYINVNVNVNGTWYNLGNTGHDGGISASSSIPIHALNHEMLLDFITNLGLPADQPYTVQFELTALSFTSTTFVNRSHDINRTANQLGSRGTPVTWAKDQNFTHIIIQEMDM